MADPFLAAAGGESTRLVNLSGQTGRSPARYLQLFFFYRPICDR